MVITDNNSAGGLIESAMGRLEGVWRQADGDWQRRARQGDERALQQHLAQLRAAMGEDGQQVQTMPVPTVHAARPAVASAVRGYGPATLFLGALASALVGAGATRWTMVSGYGIDLPVVVAVAQESTQLPLSPVVVPTAPAANIELEVRALVEHWRQAWSARDVDEYLASYGADFVPDNGMTRAQWEAARRNAILGKSRIEVQIKDLKVGQVERDRLEVAFLQDYAAGAYREIARPKTLSLTRQDGRWTIAREVQVFVGGS